MKIERINDPERVAAARRRYKEQQAAKRGSPRDKDVLPGIVKSSPATSDTEVPVVTHDLNAYPGVNFSPDHGRSMLRNLNDFLHFNGDFDRLAPFYVDLTERPVIAKGGFSYLIYMGRDTRGRDSNLPIRIAPGVLETPPEGVQIIPRSYTPRDETYYWLDFYTGRTTPPDLSNPLTSCRLVREEPSHKINYITWRGIGQELVADYLENPGKLEFDDLMPFKVKPGGLWNYSIAGRRKLSVSLENSAFDGVSGIRFAPRSEVGGRYQYLESFVGEDPNPISSFRLSQETGSIDGSRNASVERQVFADYLSGDPQLDFKDLLSIRATVGKSPTSVTLCSIDRRQICFWLDKGVLSPNEKVIFIPKQDDQELYEWMELHRVNLDTNESSGEMVTSSRILRGGLAQLGWNGPELQILRDYTDRGFSFDNLRPIPLKRKKTDVLTLWRQGNTKVYLALSRLFGLTEGQSLLLTPLWEGKDNIEFLLSKGDQQLATYSFDTAKQKFSTSEVLFKKEDAGRQEISSASANAALDSLFGGAAL